MQQLPSIGAALPAAAKSGSAVHAVPDGLRSILTSIPASAAVIQEVNAGDPSRSPVVIIQDVHLNAEAQANIAATLKSLVDGRAVSAVGVEGAFGAFDFNQIHAFSDARLTEIAARAFLDESLLSGASFAGVVARDAKTKFIGVDEPAAYRANVAAYLASRPLVETRAAAIKDLRGTLNARKEARLTPDLLAFDRLRDAFRDGSAPLSVYLKALASHAEPEFVVERFLAAHDMESRIDFDRVSQERRAVIEKLVMKLSEAEVNDLFQTSAAYRLGQISYASYYEGLRALCARKGIDLRATPAFDEYIQYVLLADSIRADELFAAIDRMDKAAIASMATSDEAKALIDSSDAAGLAAKLLRFELTPADWSRYSDLKATPAGAALPDLSTFESFYTRAAERSRI
ncbi:MAG: hypothetical protein JO102_03565, partial [Elusimicrobia bacterium]|nr:hypothetical protein [Elusimicrobiota bacterium]